MEKKTYTSPTTFIHRLKMESMILTTTRPLNGYVTRVNVDLAMTPTYGGPVIDDDEEDY